MCTQAGPRITLSWAGQQPLQAQVVSGQQKPQILGWRFADMEQGHQNIPIPTLVLDCELSCLPHTQAYLISVAPAAEPMRDEALVLTHQPGQTVIELLAAGAAIGKVRIPDTLDNRPAAAASDPQRMVLDWRGSCHGFPF